ncbi:MAG: Uma2 family endonuclease [Lachnospiraceae bacterium]|nr:Uma2 family endonuclease [Lachnospiraceae bacterium]
MPLPKSDNYTIDYIYSLPAGQRAELIDGVVYDMAPPNTIHQRLVNRFSQKITNYIDSKQGDCEVFPAPFAVFLNADDKNYIEPDISVICDKNKLDDKGCNGAPDFIIEIVSPSSRKMDYRTKMTLYADAGVREYWIVDPEKERTTVYRYEEDAAPMIVPFQQEITVGIYGDLNINISELLK